MKYIFLLLSIESFCRFLDPYYFSINVLTLCCFYKRSKFNFVFSSPKICFELIFIVFLLIKDRLFVKFVLIAVIRFDFISLFTSLDKSNTFVFDILDYFDTSDISDTTDADTDGYFIKLFSSLKLLEY